MNRILLSAKPSIGIRLLDETGLLAQVVPEVMPMHGMAQGAFRYKDVYEHTLQVVDRTRPDLILRWAALLHDIAKPRTFSVQNDEVHFFGHEVIGAHMAREILTRLRQPHEVVAQVEQIVAQHLRVGLYDETWTDGAVRRFLRESIPVTERLLDLARADVTSANARARGRRRRAGGRAGGALRGGGGAGRSGQDQEPARRRRADGAVRPPARPLDSPAQGLPAQPRARRPTGAGRRGDRHGPRARLDGRA